MIKLRKTSQNGTAFILVADEEQSRLVLYEERTCTVYHSQTLNEPPCGRLGVQGTRYGAVYFDLNASEVESITAGFNRRRARDTSGDLIDANYVRANYAHLPVTRDCGRVRTRTRRVDAPTPVSSSGNHQTSVYPYHSRQVTFTRDEAIESGDVLGMGIELEVIHPHGRTAETESAVLKAVRDSDFTLDDCYVELDGTVTFEIVFNAFTLEKWRELEPKLTTLCRLLSRAGFESERGGRCGLHTHISRKYLKENGDALIYAIHMNNEAFFKRLSRRGTGSYSYCNFRPIDLNRLLIEKETGNNHSIAINNGSENTVELRYWRGTLNVTRIMQQLEFIQQLVDGVNARDSFEILFTRDDSVLASWFTGKAREYIYYRNNIPAF